MPHQKFQSARIRPRYAKGALSTFGANSVYPRIPWVAAWWSFTFPGFGHIFLGRYLPGFILIIWELVVNTQANLNMGIALSMLGKFEEAKAVINEEWVLLYMGAYIFSIWDSYRSAVEISKSHILSEVEDAPVGPSVVSAFDIIIVDKRKPWLAAVWSAISPGLGQLYSGHTITGTFILAWWIFVTYKANMIGTWFYSSIGDFTIATAMADWQWFLFIPSMYAFAIYHAYVTVNEINILYDIEQTRYLRVRDENLAQEKQNALEKDTLQIIATFEHSPFVEMAIHDFETIGIPTENIVALPLENLESDTYIIDSLHRVDGRSVLDGAMVSGAIFMVLGTIYGFVWEWGPVIWGLLGLLGGFFLGLIIELAFHKNKTKLFASRKNEVYMQVTCNSSMKEHMIKILKARKANGYLILPQRITPDV
ncbi:hypothetical protein NC661_12525 [Aquibacillus koreensis]|uniref:Uncharacterized protein n=1 Tax=Aquibacillus koreensis TaxID=279446 RepID=A0A9X4AIP4_9BACI|nr:hypothetical protein [Aquibacillus koreensis]MCT2537771.1 hypothetical protein [Aquibacillus koreensis]MDC3421196.1 hypothetical protein [Aquibacillus koreensis]